MTKRPASSVPVSGASSAGEESEASASGRHPQSVLACVESWANFTTFSGVCFQYVPYIEPRKGNDVEKINQYSFFELGQSLQQLKGISVGEKVEITQILGCFNAQNRLEALKNGKPVPVHVCSEALTNLLSAINEFVEAHYYTENDEGKKEFKRPDDNAVIKSAPHNRMMLALNAFETIFSAEIREVTTYFVPERGIYNTSGLVDRADDSFPENIKIKLPDKTTNDWRAAGRCLAFNLLTASGFHACRAVEGTIEIYYKHFSGKDETLKSWNEYVIALEKIEQNSSVDSKPLMKTITEIKQMKDDFRNPIAHPRVILQEGDARILFANSESLIIAMIQEIS